MKTKRRWAFLWHGLFIITILAMLYPILFALSNSFKPDQEAYTNATALFTAGFSFDNYIKLFTRLPLLRIILNTFVISTVITLVRMLISFLSAYGIVYFGFKGKKIVMAAFMLSMFVPFTAIMIPNYLILSKIGLLDTLLGVILPQIFSGSAIFLLVQSMRTIPLSLIEVAKLENMKDATIMRKVVLPLVKPQLIATSIWFFALSWNEFIWARLILDTTENYTLPFALQMFISGEGGDGFTSAMAMSVVTMIIPLVMYLIFQKSIIATFTSSGIK